jgi:hypothetical protein
MQAIAAEVKTQIATNKIKATLKSQTTAFLMQCARDLMNVHTEGSGLVFVYTLDEIESRMTETEFVEFCDSL